MVTLSDIAHLNAESAKREILEALTSLLGSRTHSFTEDSAADLAHALANQQGARWTSLFSFLRHPQISTAASHYFKPISDYILEQVSTSITKENEDTSRVESTLPLVLRDPARSLIDRMVHYPFFSMATLLRRCPPAVLDRNDPELAKILAAIGVAEEALLAGFAKEAERLTSLVETKLEPYNLRATGAEKKVQRAIERLQSVQQETSRIQSGVVSELGTLLERGRLATEELEQARGNWEVTSKNTLVALRDEVRELAKIETSVDLWEAKGRTHTHAYRAQAVLFCLAIALAVGWLLYSGQSYVERLASIPANGQILAAALLAIPAIGVAWLLRFIARLALQNLLLAQDAHQRHAQVTTYLRLLGDASKPISEKERILALAALFRPLPGQGGDDVNPPTVADLLKDAQELALRRAAP